MLVPSAQKVRPRFFFNPFRSKVLWFFCGAHFAFSLFLGPIFAFAPDEAGYLHIFHSAYRSGFKAVGLTGWSSTSVIFLRIIYLPAKLLTFLGVSEYLAIRLLAIVTSAVAIYFLIAIAKDLRFGDKKSGRFLFVILLIPSGFLWVSLGLRESFIFLSLSMLCTSIYLLGRAFYRSSSVLFLLGSTLLCYTKGYLYILVFFSTFFLILLRSIQERRFKSAYLLLVVGLVVPLLLTPANTAYLASGVLNQVRSPSPGSSSAQSLTSSNEGGVTQANLASDLNTHPDSLFSKLMKSSGVAAKSKLGGSSKLTVSPAHLRKPLTMFPASLRYLFLPSPLTNNGSTFLNLAALEMPIWWGLYFFTGYSIIGRLRRREKLGDLAVWAMFFAFGFVAFSSLIEGNVGTLLRHRSVLLVPIVAIVISLQSSLKSDL
jgi:hypothetical protein